MSSISGDGKNINGKRKMGSLSLFLFFFFFFFFFLGGGGGFTHRFYRRGGGVAVRLLPNHTPIYFL